MESLLELVNVPVKMTFRNGGRGAANDIIYLGTEPLTIVNTFKYLGLTLQTTARSFRVHTKSRAAAATKAMFDIKSITKLSLETATALFDAKIVPIATYGIDITWDKLSLKDFATLEAVKSRFLKAALGVSKYTKSRLIYELAKETLFVEDLRLKFSLPFTVNWERSLQERKKKREEIWPNFYATEAMIDRSWTGTNQELRHFVNSLAVHGYHHKVCKNKGFHDPDNNCVCELCEQPCDHYHITVCKKLGKSLIEFCKS